LDANQGKTKGSSSAFGVARLSAVASNSTISIQQIAVESVTGEKSPHPIAVEATQSSKDDAEKKVSDSASQTTPANFATPTGGRDHETNTVTSVETTSGPPMHAPSSEARDVPTLRHVLDQTPAPNPVPATRLPADLAGDTQMHVGIRTTAFGAVEIYTSVHQNQVGVAVHAEHGMAHWFSGEVSNIESGLKDHHLNLTTLKLDSSGTSLNNGGGSDQRHSQRNFASSGGWSNQSRLSEIEMEPIEAVTALPSLPGESRVSIHI
jgi:hypothetical protein